MHFTLGRLGLALGQRGDIPEAVRVTREALELCTQAGDTEGVQAYTQNLDALGAYQITDSASGVRFSVVFIDANGRTLMPEELPGVTGRIRWEVRYTGQIDPEARRLHDEGRAVGAEGRHDAAIATVHSGSGAGSTGIPVARSHSEGACSGRPG